MTTEITLAPCPTEREQFEAWAEGRMLVRDGDGYVSAYVQNDWEVWQAARAQAPAPHGPADEEILEAAADFRPHPHFDQVGFAREVLARWGDAEQPSAALLKQLLAALETAAEDSDEVLGNYKQLYSERYRPQRLASQQATVDANKAAISAAREWLGITGAPNA